jgi:hypothetical protein
VGVVNPDVLIAGVAKCGTTTLYEWLGAASDVFFPRQKEPNFFCDDAVFRRGAGWYRELFADARSGQLTGDASVQCMVPDRSERAAARLAEMVPDVRIVVSVRHPVDRVRSHYRHEVQRGRERRALVDALRAAAAPYIAQSCYFRCLAPYLERFPHEQLCVVRMEDLTSDDAPAWPVVLRHLALPESEPPRTAHNVTASKPGYTPVMRWVFEHGLAPLAQRLPASIRRRARPILLRDDDDYRDQLALADDDIPSELLAPIDADRQQLAASLGISWPD